ncbi:ATP-dependent protease ATPase subunit HslU [Candidatus Caldatribacterium sp.]|uniref:ATP-dependent protease ATPase subunit HslU n=1 Tax=Candidatus Caldatribacterium sp. TaxID=2282143 RepID=UPI002997069D|nr:ATP-dependent protease ATPase subunit HslU [Candidatus Caldatribacterium sp.]MDW8080753.1 ATP-dependent protease ATPase subunit HslU [Candidatus Calescibacterium sp.]
MRGDDLTPEEIVRELDKYIVGQDEAKKCVAIALRNRVRRRMLPPEIAEEITPKNIIMIGPTGVGKTEIARRIAKLTNAPFLKVEATKFTEVGYVGRDVESIIRDLTELAIRMVKNERIKAQEERVREIVEERILDALLAQGAARDEEVEFESSGRVDVVWPTVSSSLARTRERLREKLRRGELEERIIEIEVEESSVPVEIVAASGIENLGIDLREIFGGLFPPRKKRKRMKIKDAREVLFNEEVQKALDMDDVVQEAIRRVEETGIVFIDEIDKIVSPPGGGYGPDVSRGGVQRDLLPIVEGSTVLTKHGPVRTNHILFIAAGAFSQSKPSDLLPELQGRFPIRVELSSLSEDDLYRILVEPYNSLVKQYKALLSTEGVSIEFTEDALREIAHIAHTLNEKMENIGARRLYTVMERVLQDISFNAPKLKGQHIVIDRDYVRKELQDILKDEDVTRYIL